MRIVVFIIPLIWFLGGENVLGQSLNELRFANLSQKDGLPHNHVECIIKDSDGFVWFGTRNGLSKFNGYEIKTYYAGGENSLSGNRILSINEDHKGRIWIGTYNNGLNVFDKQTETFTNYGPEIGIGSRVEKINVLADSTVWICTDWGLVRYFHEADSFHIYRADEEDPFSISSNVVFDVLLTKRGEYYVATDSYFIQELNIETGKFTTINYNRDKEYSVDYRKRMVEDWNGVIWISAHLHGLSWYDPVTGESDFYGFGKNSLSNEILTGSVVLDSENNLWIGSDGGGVNVFNTETRTFSYLLKEERTGSISDNSIYTIYIDDRDVIWLGTFDEGVDYYDPEHFKFSDRLFKPNDIAFFDGMSVISVYQDKKNNIWVGTDGDGMYKINTKGDIKAFHHDPLNPNSLSTNVVTSIGEDNYGNILIGTYTGGFMVYNQEKDRFKKYQQTPNESNKLGSSSVWDILQDSQGRIWLALLAGGYDQFIQEEELFYNHGPYASPNDPLRIDFPNVMTVYEDSQGDIWFGTEGRGVFILDNQLDKMIRLPADTIHTVTTQGLIKSIFEDQWGNIWIGTEGDGLYIYNRKENTYIHYNHIDALPGNIVLGFSEDVIGNIWIATSKGLSVYSPETGTFRNYYESDGLSSSSFNQGAMIRISDGRIIAGTSHGLDVFRPDRIKPNLKIPPIVLLKLSILNQEIKTGMEFNDRVVLEKGINYTDEITLTHKDKAFSIDFAALNYTLPEKVLYKYMLEGFDKDWIQIGAKNRSVSYTNLPAGEYTLKILASNNDAVWGDNQRELRIKVLPPFYLTLWFKSLVALLFILLVYSAYRYRLNSIKSSFLQKQFDQDKRIMELEKEKLDSELQKLTFHVLNRNRELINQKNRLMGLSMKAKESVRIGLQDIISKFDEELNDDKDWKYIEPQLDKVYNNFVSRLKEKHQSLSVAEIKIAAYVRMDLSTKDIAEFMHKTTRAIENDRYRLRKKLELGTNDSLKDYLNNL